ncbi:hypothetical protein WR25_15538 [Diploscapter pachys]|uniref:Uncharacterized protein n=1 Tax=Diploscapter pachys TaxID=2018661 RepID=A0A2A2JHL8_9BILA|nr:hypothetical protein WR25_15538 [Diploscapter pachys]
MIFEACVSKFADNCKLWPNPKIQLPNVTESMQAIIDGLDYLTCVPEYRSDGPVCRCCCHPYTPNPYTFECELKPYLNGR